MFRPFKRLSAAALCGLLTAAPLLADMLPPASAHIKVTKAEIAELDCSRRKFKLENTRETAKWFPYMGSQIAGSNWHPHSIFLGVLGSVLLAPLTVLAVPTDLAAGPFRKECRYKLRVTGSPVEWAGKPLPAAAVKLEGRTLVKSGVPELVLPEFFKSQAEGTTNAEGLFVLELPGYAGREKSMGLLWHINGRPGGTMRVERRGDHFLLTEVDPGFGVGIQEMEPMTIKPVPAAP